MANKNVQEEIAKTNGGCGEQSGCIQEDVNNLPTVEEDKNIQEDISLINGRCIEQSRCMQEEDNNMPTVEEMEQEDQKMPNVEEFEQEKIPAIPWKDVPTNVV